MAGTFRLEVQGVRDVDQALRAIEDGIDQGLTATIQAAIEPIAALARTLTPRGSGPRADAKNLNDRLPHVADTIFAMARGAVGEIVSPHPASGVLEYGGTITPNHHKITFPAHAMAHRAADADDAQISADLERRIDELIARAGL